MEKKYRYNLNLIILLLFIVACVVRISTVVVMAHDARYDPYENLVGNRADYVNLAKSLQRGSYLNPQPTADKPPVYPLFLAGIFSVFGDDLTLVLYIQAMISAFSTLLVYGIGRQIGSRKAAMTAYVFSIFYYPFWYSAGTLMRETLMVFLILLFIHALIRWFNSGHYAGSGFWAGLSAGAASLIKSVVLPVIPLYLFIFLKQKKSFRGAFAFAVGAALILAPWGMRNYLRSGRFFLTSTNGGYHALLLYNAHSRDFALYKRDPGFISEDYPGIDALLSELKINPTESHVLTEYLQGRAYMKHAVQFIKSHPGHFLRAVPATLWNMWRVGYPNERVIGKTGNLAWNNLPVYFCRVNDMILYAAMLPFFLIGIYTAIRKRSEPALLVAVFIISFVVLHSFIPAMIRYRLAVMPLFFLLSALGLWRRELTNKV
ncbi:MAG: glycosyltransferase family 39 protein [Candidatus Omnitrophica bacterium]|nr:glycosyltransferase family 39 protein [Candidatus Omnitrophota bacterium]